MGSTTALRIEYVPATDIVTRLLQFWQVESLLPSVLLYGLWYIAQHMSSLAPKSIQSIHLLDVIYFLLIQFKPTVVVILPCAASGKCPLAPSVGGRSRLVLHLILRHILLILEMYLALQLSYLRLQTLYALIQVYDQLIVVLIWAL